MFLRRSHIPSDLGTSKSVLPWSHSFWRGTSQLATKTDTLQVWTINPFATEDGGTSKPMHVLFWLPLLVVLLHIVEEFVWPGGFADWYARWFPHTRQSFTKGYGFFVNGLLILVAFLLGLLGPDWSRAVSLWICVVAILGSNAIFHFIGVLKFKTYSPGVFTGTLLSLPLLVLGSGHFLQTGKATPSMVMFSVIVGSFFNVWAIVRHKWRAAAIAQST